MQAGALLSESAGPPFPHGDKGPALHSALGCGRAVCHLPLSSNDTVTSRTYLTHLGLLCVLSTRVDLKLCHQKEERGMAEL